MSPCIGVVTKDKYRTWEMKSLARSARKRGVNLVILDPVGCSLDLISGRPLSPKGVPLPLDACLGRVDAGCLDAAVRLLQLLEDEVPILNGSDVFRQGRDKRLMSRALARAGIPHPETWLVAPKDVARFARRLPFPLVCKPAVGSEGRGVFLIEGPRRLFDIAQDSREPLYLQAFCKGIKREVRLLVLDGAVLGAISRRPRSGEWRANLSLGAVAQRVPIARECEELALRAAAALGADFAGVDLALLADGAMVLEVNVCPGFRGFAQATGIDVATHLINALFSRMEKEGVDDESAVAHRKEVFI